MKEDRGLLLQIAQPEEFEKNNKIKAEVAYKLLL